MLFTAPYARIARKYGAETSTKKGSSRRPDFECDPHPTLCLRPGTRLRGEVVNGWVRFHSSLEATLWAPITAPCGTGCLLVLPDIYLDDAIYYARGSIVDDEAGRPLPGAAGNGRPKAGRSP